MEIYQRVLKEHGLDLKARAEANKVVYDIPHLEMSHKPRTPVIKIVREFESQDMAAQWQGKLTVQRPFDFETTKRMRL